MTGEFAVPAAKALAVEGQNGEVCEPRLTLSFMESRRGYSELDPGFHSGR
jgi:hypothetical protein